MKINEYLVKISASTIPINKPLELGSEGSLMVDFAVVKVADTDNQDGTCNRVFVIKGIVGSVVHEGKIIGGENV